MAAYQKVFGIGFHKTATTSLAVALYILGYNVTGYFGTHDPNIENNVYKKAQELANRYDAAQDTPWPVLYKKLDNWYPGSKFILTVRPKEKWVKSVVKHFKKHHIPAHEWIYGVKTAAGNESVYIRRYEEHNREVMEYFADRPDDLLVMEITKGDGWEKLCPFLGAEIPTIQFPKDNTAKEMSQKIVQRGIRYLKRLTNQKKDRLMNKGVSAAFVRDIFHYHDSMSENLWPELLQLPRTRFEQKNPFTGYSTRDYMIRLINEENCWFNRFMVGIDYSSILQKPLEQCKQDELYDYWKRRRPLQREFIAHLSDEECNTSLTDGDEIIWEVIVHLMNYGIEQRSLIRQLLVENSIDSNNQTFINFYRNKKCTK